MRRTIENPYRVNHKLYFGLICSFSFALFISFIIASNEKEKSSALVEVLKNLSYGCIASTVVAWLIDIANTERLNSSANQYYDAIYGELQFEIGAFIGVWAELCAVSFKDKDYHQEKHTWDDWFRIVKENYQKCDDGRQEQLFPFYCKQLRDADDAVRKSIGRIRSQQHILTINGMMNSDISQIITDFKFEFDALWMDLIVKNNNDMFWTHMEAITNDLRKYIENWSDIQYYNLLLFRPFRFFEKTDELVNAVMVSSLLLSHPSNKKDKLFRLLRRILSKNK